MQIAQRRTYYKEVREHVLINKLDTHEQHTNIQEMPGIEKREEREKS